MPYIEDININKSILHILNNDGTSPILASTELRLEDELYKYIFKNIEKVSKDKAIKCAKFNQGVGVLKSLSERYFEDHLRFIALSKELSDEFYDIMKENPTIPSGDLLFSDLATNKGRVLSILKLDHVATVEHIIDNSKIEIKNSVGLPLSGSKIQKAVFILKEEDELGYNVIFLDKGKAKKDDGYDNNYFLNQFIDGHIINTSLDYTKNVVKTTINWIDDNVEDAVQALELKNNLKNVLKESNESANIADLADSILNNDLEKADSLRECFEEELGVEEIEIDSMYIEKEFNKTKLKVDETIDITIPTEIFKDSSKVEIIKNEDGSLNFILKFINEITEK